MERATECWDGGGDSWEGLRIGERGSASDKTGYEGKQSGGKGDEMDGTGSQVRESEREGSLKGHAVTRRLRWQVEGLRRLRSRRKGAGRRGNSSPSPSPVPGPTHRIGENLLPRHDLPTCSRSQRHRKIALGGKEGSACVRN